MERTSNAASHLVVCPECGGRVTVDEDALDLLLTGGCVYCGAGIQRSNVEELE